MILPRVRHGLLSLLFLSLAPPAAYASPPSEPANFASASLLALSVLLGSSRDPALTTHAARDPAGPQALLDLVPDTCEKKCSDYAAFEVPCMLKHTDQACGQAFCTLDRIDGFIGCLNCLILVGNTTNISKRRFPTAATQLTLLQNACTQTVGLLAPQTKLLPYSSIGDDPTGGLATNGAPTTSSSLAKSSGTAGLRRGRIAWLGMVLGVVGVGWVGS